MKQPALGGLKKAAPFLAVMGLLSVAAGAREMQGSDHVDTAEVEVTPTLDLNDVYAFPGSSDDRIAFVIDVASPTNALGRNVQGFNPNALYQLYIDNNGDAQADRVLQFLFDQMSDGTQRVNVLGPGTPMDEDDGIGVASRLLTEPVSQGNPFNQEFTTENGMRVFAGPRADPFFIDFEQFVQIIPDRRPATFLNNVDEDGFTPTAFCGDSEPFVTTCEPKDILEGANTLSIVVEMPESMLGAGGGADARVGVWATISR
jgi:hypothetical protein